ncbi:caspase-1-like [Neocloeon triangulifer]|uniref:caspase-1-like n=1 Tax=Neocloeon triangulifer TaxID=2078957 RepID=UPI00286F09AB|nr:caspase-1-like [Neocloeon triangulifer]
MASNGNDVSEEVQEEVLEDHEEGEDEADISKKLLKKLTNSLLKRATIETKVADIVSASPIPDNVNLSNATRYYNMNHEKRGVALIFNHYKFDADRMPMRKGTDEDKERLIKAFKKHAFRVHFEDDLCISDIKYVINREIVKVDHSKSDCVAIAIMTHGSEGDKIYAKDSAYCLHDLVSMLTADKCPTLAGKPKLFFIQACRGEGQDGGHTIRTDSPRSGQYTQFRIPNQADFFLAYSTIPGYVAMRNQLYGSWFVKELCKKLMEDDSHARSIFQLMTEVVGKVAIDYETKGDHYKQIPTFTSRLTKDLVFGKKAKSQ